MDNTTKVSIVVFFVVLGIILVAYLATVGPNNAQSPTQILAAGYKITNIPPNGVWSTPFATTGQSDLVGSFTVTVANGAAVDAFVVNPDNYASFTNGQYYQSISGCDTGLTGGGSFLSGSCNLGPGNWYLVVHNPDGSHYSSIEWPTGLSICPAGVSTSVYNCG
jgi:hypothetical protein